MPISAKREKYLEWLARTDVDITDVSTIAELQQQLVQELGMDIFQQKFNTTARLKQFLQTSTFIKKTLAAEGIRPISVEYPWGTVLRFGIKGSPGLYGINYVRFLLEKG